MRAKFRDMCLLEPNTHKKIGQIKGERLNLNNSSQTEATRLLTIPAPFKSSTKDLEKPGVCDEKRVYP